MSQTAGQEGDKVLATTSADYIEHDISSTEEVSLSLILYTY
jgi:hypothetical protein